MSESKSKTLSWPLIFLIIIVVMLMTAGTSYLMVYLFGGSQTSTVRENEIKVSQTTKMGPTKSMGEFVVNLTSTRSYRYIKTEVYVELEDEELSEEIDERYPQLRDAINAILRSQTEEDIKEPELVTLKQKILEKINEYLVEGKVKNVYFDEFVIQ